MNFPRTYFGKLNMTARGLLGLSFKFAIGILFFLLKFTGFPKKNFFKSGMASVIPLLLFCYSAIAQTFQPFPDSNAIWTIGVYDVYGAFHYNYNYRLNSTNTDTAINNLIYKKIYLYDTTALISYKGALRQDTTRKVFYIPKDSLNEKLLYDFSANIGDTVYNVYSDYNVTEPLHNEVIHDVDSVNIAGLYHKRLKLDLNFYWIEGIGSSGGLFETTYGGTFWDVYKLDCFAKAGVSVYSSSTGNCLANGISDFTPKSKRCEVYPNPGNGDFILKYDAPFNKECNLYIYNSLGACVFKTLVPLGKNEQCLDLKNMTEGIYFYKLEADTFLISDKLIIEK